MMLKSFKFLILSFLVVSCTMEKYNFSPSSGFMGTNFTTNSSSKGFVNTTTEINYAAELSNFLSTIPNFNNQEIDSEILNLKAFVNDYLYAWRDYDTIKEEKAMSNIEDSFKKLQKTKSVLNMDDQDVLNRYLSKIKTTLSMLETYSDNH